jgi:ABC-2 type transport system permease protein
MKQELILLLKQKSIQYMLWVSVALTSVSLLNGWLNVQHMQAQIQHAQMVEKNQHSQQLNTFLHDGKIEAGDVGYYVFHHVYRQPDAWSFIALGNYLVTPYVQRIRLLGLQGQIYDGESHHPEYVMLGAFDYAFWLVFFLPLICIALLHDLKASESQAQRLTFLGSVIANPIWFWAKRVLLRWLLVLLTFVIPVTMMTCMLTLPLEGFITVITTTLLYSIFWVVVCSLISLRRKVQNASTNAMILASIWLLLCIVLPNLSQLWLHHRHPVQDGSQIALQHRQLVHSAWDLPKTDTLDPFYKLYPQWQHTPPVTGRFHWKWYYAFQHMADVNLAEQVKIREKNLGLRDEATANLSFFLPNLWAQRQLENVAKSNINHLLDHRKAIEAFHTQLRHTLYPYLFEDKPMSAEAFQALPKFNAAIKP